MVRKKISKTIIKAAGIMSFFMCTNIVSLPVYAADNNINSECFYNDSVMSKELTNNIIEQNGNKITVNKIYGSKNKVKVCLTIESNKSLNDYNIHNGFNMHVSMEGVESNHESISSHMVQANKKEYEVELGSESEFKEAGIIRIDVVDGYNDLNASLKIPVDFKGDFEKNYTKDLSGEIKDTGILIKQFVSDSFETGVVLTSPNDDIYGNSMDKSNFIINVDGKIYLTDDIYVSEKDGKRYIITNSKDLTYDQIKDAKNITVRNCYNSMTEEEAHKYYKNYDIKDSILGEISNKDNGESDFSIKFNDDTEGKIKAVKENDKLKVYCTSDSNEKSMLMAINIFARYNNENNDYHDGIEDKIIYKNTNVDNQYVVEFNNVNNDKTSILSMEKIILENDKFIFGDEIKVK